MEDGIGRERGGDKIIVTSIPFALQKSTVIERIAEVIIGKKLPMLVDVRDESTDDVRIVLELKPGADPNLVMAYLFKHTPLETGFHVNLTCLVPTENKEIAGPLRVDLAAMLREFIEFRQETVRRRFEFELAELKKRIHILEGFAKIFDELDEAVQDHPQVRRQGGRGGQAVGALQAVRPADRRDPRAEAVQAGAPGDPGDPRRAEGEARRAKEIQAILDDKRKLMRVVRGEIAEVAARFPTSAAPRSAARAARTWSSSPRTSSSTSR
jgi:DNA gyrase subunit A